MTNSIASFIASFSADAISNAFIYLILSLLAVSVVLAAVSKASRFTAATTNILTSLGILGTFAGIVVGLMDFDPTNIDGSIESLLSGLKTAFLTSLVGMAASILYKAILGALPKKDVDAQQAVGPEEIFSVMSQQLKASTDQLNASNELIAAIKGDEDSSLTSQIKNLRTDINDGQRALNEQFKQVNDNHNEFKETLWAKMDEFGDLLSKSATEQVINALKEVIVEFNDKLTEQFGENFKRLDESVKKLVDWQENYRVQLEDMATKYQLGVDAISSTEKSVANINERAESIPATMEKLHQVMELGHGQVTELEHRLEAFKDLRDKAVEAMPQIREQMDTTMSVIGDSVKAASSHYENMLHESQTIIDNFSSTANQSVEVMRTNLEEGATKLAKELTTSAEKISHQLADAGEDFVQVTEDGVEGIKESFEVGVKKIAEELDSTTKEISTTLSSSSEQFAASTEESMNTMRSNLESGAQDISAQLKESAQDIGGKLAEASSDIQEQVGTATGGLSNVTNHLTDTTEQIRQHLEDSITELNGQLRVLVADIKDDSKETGRVLKEANQDLLASTKEIQQETTNAITKLHERLETTLEDVFQVQAQAVRRTFDSLEDQITDAVGKTGSAVEKQVEVLDLQMQQEINRTISEMGEALATVTQQFTRDYKALVREMNNVVTSSKMAV
ncbi:membrane protein [Vibrio caribbeanicus]|uniref:Membrane protein n=1 Tax=Vibrio caribbeanicus TaxID=701175 RepID=A0ACC4NYW0_9VIBR|nr:membrane protein [Vibrio caribbeanicus]KHD25429.1 membrane protein [Vibrio caribbeanicus]